MSRSSGPLLSARPWLWRWGPVILWMAVLSAFSTDAFAAAETGRFLGPLLRWLLPAASQETLALLHGIFRKGMHVAEFAALALLWYRALERGEAGWRGRTAWAAFLLAVAFAVLDETHQAFEPRRTGSPVDVAWDSLGAACGLLGLRVLRGRGKANAPGGIPPGRRPRPSRAGGS